MMDELIGKLIICVLCIGIIALCCWFAKYF